MQNKAYVVAIKEGSTGYDVYYEEGGAFQKTHVIRNVNRNIVQKAIGSDLEYLLKCSPSSAERFRPLEHWEISDFNKHKET